MSKEAEIFYANFEFEDEPVNGIEQLKEEHIVELLDAYGEKKVKSVKLQVRVLMNSIKATTTLATKVALEGQLERLLDGS